MSTRIVYLRTTTGQPVGCLAISQIKNNQSTCYVSYNLSVLNPSDNFNRKVARNIAIGRLEKNPDTYKAFVLQNANMHMITRSVMADIMNNKAIPNRAIKAAKLWLNNHPGLVLLK